MLIIYSINNIDFNDVNQERVNIFTPGYNSIKKLRKLYKLPKNLKYINGYK